MSYSKTLVKLYDGYNHIISGEMEWNLFHPMDKLYHKKDIGYVDLNVYKFPLEKRFKNTRMKADFFKPATEFDCRIFYNLTEIESMELLNYLWDNLYSKTYRGIFFDIDYLEVVYHLQFFLLNFNIKTSIISSHFGEIGPQYKLSLDEIAEERLELAAKLHLFNNEYDPTLCSKIESITMLEY